jgi:hypothetical protein
MHTFVLYKVNNSHCRHVCKLSSTILFDTSFECMAYITIYSMHNFARIIPLVPRLCSSNRNLKAYFARLPYFPLYCAVKLSQ